MSSTLKRRDDATHQVETEISKAIDGAATEAYRLQYAWASVRVRVISEKFAGLSRVEREGLVDPILRRLPDDVQRDVIMLLLLTPAEHASRVERTDLLDVEFDDPVRAGH